MTIRFIYKLKINFRFVSVTFYQFRSTNFRTVSVRFVIVILDDSNSF